MTSSSRPPGLFVSFADLAVTVIASVAAVPLIAVILIVYAALVAAQAVGSCWQWVAGLGRKTSKQSNEPERNA